MAHELATNKKNAIDFYKIAFEGHPRAAVEKYVGDDYNINRSLVMANNPLSIVSNERFANIRKKVSR